VIIPVRNIYSTLGHRDSNLRNFTSGRIMHLLSGTARLPSVSTLKRKPLAMSDFGSETRMNR